ncbi:dihydroxyacetone kinase subunit DhaK [uncultured Sneathia sp.]|uniref:dihydroxyacetone kinase subunit DhaK n=1 Tax=uncultured Sneathia sp. TaxID=278067 RepID=UPI002599DC49|nr:dihydroxyacetone kinase subunit DhaK [uncultured Sneathia sp.]
MKKIINKKEDYVKELVNGIVKAHSDKVKLLNDDFRILVKKEKLQDKVGLVTGGGSGHLPLFLGYVGEGMLDACAIGNVFASPSSKKMYEAIKYVDSGKGVLCVYGNYGGDKMNFSMARDESSFDDIEVEEVIVSDDIASSNDKKSRRGVSGLVYAYKIAGTLAKKGYTLKEVKSKTEKALENIRTMGIALTPCIVPEVGKPTFTILENEMEIGMGIHGEKGISTTNIKTAKEIVDIILNKIETEIKLEKGDKISVLVNGLGATSLDELYIVYNEIYDRYSKIGVNILKPLIGEYATSMEMAGLSITVFKLDNETEELLLSEDELTFMK